MDVMNFKNVLFVKPQVEHDQNWSLMLVSFKFSTLISLGFQHEVKMLNLYLQSSLHISEADKGAFIIPLSHEILTSREDTFQHGEEFCKVSGKVK